MYSSFEFKEATNFHSRGIANRMLAGVSLYSRSIYLQLPELTIQIASNSCAVIEALEHYFKPFLSAPTSGALEIIAVEAETPEWGFEWNDWAREEGKKGKKDAYVDLVDGRVLHKVRTGMMFLQSETYQVAIGPCEANLNQLINFVNNQYMNILQQRGWLICHAAALSNPEGATLIAGFSGGGKSTSMLQMMANEGNQFLSNDRVFIRREGDQLIARGVPKLPRVNPGTLLNNPQLIEQLPAERREALKEMPRDQLWQLEEKYDVDLLSCYGAQSIRLEAPVRRVILLNWDHTNDAPTELKTVDIDQRRELLGTIRKSPGPFYQGQDGVFLHGPVLPPEQLYLQRLAGLEIIEASGGVDFERLVELDKVS